jgi:hypothetical protein
MSRILVLLIAGVLAFPPAAALAQDRSISVFFEPCDVQQLNDAIAAALTQPPFLLQTKNIPGALVVTIPDKITAEHFQVSGTIWTFSVAFSRNGDRLGRSVESCGEHKLSDCTDQLISDVKSAAGMGQ